MVESSDRARQPPLSPSLVRCLSPSEFRDSYLMKRQTAKQSPTFVSSRSATRNLLTRILQALRTETPQVSGRLKLEPLESRQMMAGDVTWLTTNGTSSATEDTSFAAMFAASTESPEGEPAPDLVAFATALDQAGVTFYGAAWCPFCTEQKQLFGDGSRVLPFVEVTNPDRTLNTIGQQNNITTFPTWEFPDGSRATGVLTLQELSQRSGVAIPQSERPTFAPIGNQTVEIGSPLHIPVDAYDPDGQPLTVTVSVTNPSLLQATVTNSNRSARIKVEGWGDMVFELFEDKAPRPTGRFIALAQSGFYNKTSTNQIIFHRVIDNFVLQAGDPTGTGSGGSTLGNFDDQFHPDLQHNRTGVLSYAKSLDDTNDSQFFITEGAQRHLDYNHSIFGQIVEGDAVREAISEIKLTNSRPDVPIIIERVDIFQDNENSIVMLKPLAGTGSTSVTVTVTDASGNAHSETFTVTITADNVNAQPYLADISPVTSPSSAPAQFTLNGIDLEGDAIVYEARVIDSSGATASVDQATRVVTVTPANNFTGQVRVEVAARSSTTATSTNASTRSSTMDLQVVPVTFTQGAISAPTSVALNSASDSGLSNSDGITNLSPVSFTVTGVTPGATVEILSGDTQIGVGTATATSIVITTNNFAALGNTSHVVTARQTLNNQTSGKSPAINVTYDTVVPPISASLPAQATVGVAYQGNLQNTEEGNGLRYSVVTGPNGLTIDAVTGQITWTPTSAQSGNQSLVVRHTDVAGNTRDQSFTINVGTEPLVAIRLEATDLANNVITQIAPGQEFKIRVYGDDKRVFTPQGIFALYADLLFDPALAEVSTTQTFEYGEVYQSGKSGTPGTGIVDEVGAFSSQSSFLGPGEKFVFSVRMRALSAGALTVTSDPADTDGREIALFDRDDEVPVNQVQYGSVTLNINSTFTAVNDSLTVNEDSTNTLVNVLANDTIIVPNTTLTLTAVSATSAQGGAVTLSNNQVRYSPRANFFGTDTFTYTVRDQSNNSQTATVTVTVTGVNDPPTANDDTFTTPGNTTNNLISVLTNDSFAPDTGETLRVTALGTTSAGGTVSIASNGTGVLYTPANNFVGTETFSYTLSDGSLTDTATVTVTVTTPNPPPTAVNDSFTIVEDAAAADFNVIANDSNSDPTETFALFSVGTATNGTASLSADGTRLRYQPAANFNGTDTVTYTIRDSNGASATATVTFTVTAVNDAPPAPSLNVDVVKGSSATAVVSVANLAQQNVDGASEVLTISAVGTTSAGGTVTIASDSRSVSYTPASAAFVGTDTFTYTVRDASGLTTTGTVTVSVIDFVPRDFKVQLQIADAATWDKESLSQTLSLTLTGEDFRGQQVNTNVPYDPVTGGFLMSDRAPGNYQATLPAIPFLSNAKTPQTLNINSSADSTTDVVMDVNLGDLESKYLSIRDFLSSAPVASVFAIVEKGRSHSWLIATDNSQTPANISVRLSADGQQVTIEANNATGTAGRRSVTLPITSQHVDVRATSGNHYLLRLNVNPSALTYTPVTATANTSQAEGEASPLSASRPQTTSTQVPTSQPPSTSNVAGGPAVNNFSGGVVSSFSNPSSAATEQSANRSFASNFLNQPANAEGEAGPSLLANDQAQRSQKNLATNAPETIIEDVVDLPQAVDSAMLDLLPALQLRSLTAEGLAESENSEDNKAAVDATFQWLGSR